ncbi:septum formation protein Maf [Rhodovibrio sodomensis]|uniref:Nucleoside triphosphate pyrophosphatase n=1 Tax=Rhodovibrio sodomensis TaxID=1088 RepID=A0ABS1DLQ1_9PROT|nr:Maf family protein [Rhodovibrio sodomensis]MBK1671397.1 septum formation protein Maf [Rhodovibrio sodomensis]
MTDTAAAPAPRIAGAKPDAPPFVLGSQSPTRRHMLEAAGVPVHAADRPGVDEDEVKAAFRADGAGADDVAEALAEMKAQRVAERYGGCLVMGADQMLEVDGAWLDKPRTRDQAAQTLRTLSGKTHRLIACAVVVKDGGRIWHHIDSAKLTVRPLSAGFIDSYLDTVGAAAFDSVGAYQLEGVGAQLFTQVQGDYFTVLGLPLLPLTDLLRNHGVLPS